MQAAFADFGAMTRAVSGTLTPPDLRVMLCSACWTPETVGDPDWFDVMQQAIDDDREAALASRLIETLRLGPDSLVLGLGPQSGALLRPFLNRGIPAHPDGHPAPSPDLNGEILSHPLRTGSRRVELVIAGAALSRSDASPGLLGRLAATISAQAVLAFDIVPALHILTELDIAALCRAPHAFHAIFALDRQLAIHGVRLFDALPLGQGQVRLLACRSSASHPERPGLARLRREEAAARLDRAEGYGEFSPSLGSAILRLGDFLTSAHHGRRRVVALAGGAPGALLLSVTGFGKEVIAGYVGSLGKGPIAATLPRMDPDDLHRDPPDFLLILPGADHAAARVHFAHLRRSGTRFVSTLPHVTLTA